MARNTTRRRSSPRTPRLDFAAIEITGALLTPDIVARIASFDAADQTEEAYGVPPGLKIRDEIARYFRIAEALWHQFEAAKVKSPAASERFMLDLLKQCFGFDTIKAQKTISKGEREFPVRHTALGARVPIVIAPVPADDVRRTGIDESLPQFGDGTRRRSATLLLQEYLNAEDDAVWGICADGLTLRLLRDNVSLTRPAWIEADLAKIFAESLFPDFSALWLLIHQSRFGAAGAAPTDCALEHWRDAGRIEGTAAREKLRIGVEAALIELGQGFIEHPANAELRAALSQGKLTRQAYFEELLRLVYRLIFLFAAEDRDLLHTLGAPQTAVRTYAQGYSVGRLRERCTRRTSWDKNSDVWEGLKATFRALSEGEPLLGLPALGGLFTQGQLPHLRGSRIQNRRLLAAIWRLAWMRPEGQPLTRVNWRDMETEELGSVYESLLELVPEVNASDRTFSFADDSQGKGNARKSSASFYTPDPLVQSLLDETLDPLIAETIAGKDDQAAIEALLSLRIIDPACGSGHFLLAAARRLASRIARLSSPGTPSQADYRHWLREVARRTLFGVDKNPMAIELAKVALWIETVEPGKPLSFLDAHLRCGDSLLGVYDLRALQIGIPDDAYKALTGDDNDAASAWRARNRAERNARDQGEFAFFEPPRSLIEAAQALENLDEDDLQDVNSKSDAFRRLLTGEDRQRIEAACDLYVAAFLLPKTEAPARNVGEATSFIPTSRDIWDKLEGGKPLGLIESGATAVARAAGAFHWPLEFPQVFSPTDGAKSGFDLALGNPPWDRIKLQEQEFFSARDPEIAKAPNKAARQKLIDMLKAAPQGSAERFLFDEFVQSKRIAEASSLFARLAEGDGGRFPLAGTGDVNTYALFSELSVLVSRNIGIVVPTGIATDATTAPFFASLVSGQRLRSLYSFREIRRVFTATDDRNPFCLLALAAKSPTATFCFSVDSIEEIKDENRRFTLTPEEIAAINPNTKTAPIFRSKADAELTAKIYSRLPVIIDESNAMGGNPWSIKFARMFDMSGDSRLFRTAEQLTKNGFDRDGRDWVSQNAGVRFVPLYEAKMIHHYDHRWATYDDGVGDKDSRGLLKQEKQDPSFEAQPRYWVPKREVLLRTTPLSKAFVSALRAEDDEKIALVVAHLLFADWLKQGGYPHGHDPSRGIYDHWKDFVAHHHALRGVTPSSIGLTGNSSPLFSPGNADCLPAAPIDQIVDTPREKTAWYEVDPQVLEVMLESVSGHLWFAPPNGKLCTAEEVKGFAEGLLESSCPKWLIGWRDICRSTDERTTISGAIPLSGVGDKFLLMIPDFDERRAAALLAILTSLAFDYVARQKLGGTSFKYFTMKQIAVPRPSDLKEEDLNFIVPRVAELSYTSDAMKPFADELGVVTIQPFSWDEERRARLRAELDAKIAKLYGLTRDQLRYILDPADIYGADYPSETFRVLKKNEEHPDRFGEYRTRRLVLDSWDRLERGELT